ncbi:oxidoreductase [Hypoxylon trugodes]|uniref:oxidoreductase n=1 Tax=Hypoxylon trugodes TaxID=326681 RepID=UPI00219DC20A|nr:oxidoreductase [Hypoxylon trugodes]KAI1385605.1 oxidoreductase [Hypoxylon trugodes]
MTHLLWSLVLGAGALVNGLVTPTWKLLSTESDARFRGLAPVSDRIAWVAGTSGTVLRTVDGGRTWASVGPPLSDEDATLEFRDVEAWSADRAVILSIGEGNSSRVYLTSDGGASWEQTFTNEEPTAFYDCIAFESPRHGMAMSDPVDGKVRLIETHDGGASWDIVDSGDMPPAREGESGFAASGTCLTTTAGRWYIGSGGVEPGRVFRSADGHHWDVSNTSIAGGDGSGVFSVQFRDAKNGIAVGGNYSFPTGVIDNAAWSNDGGKTWIPSTSFPGGYRSGSTWVPGLYNIALAVGPTGSDLTLDGGRKWHVFDNGSFDSVECVKGPVCWASGEQGRVARLTLT